MKTLAEIWNQLTTEQQHRLNSQHRKADKMGERTITLTLTVKEAITLAVRTKERVDEIWKEQEGGMTGADALNRSSWGLSAADRVFEQVGEKQQGRAYLKARQVARTYEDELRSVDRREEVEA